MKLDISSNNFIQGLKKLWKEKPVVILSMFAVIY